jgi:hypothetical protein
MGLQEDWVRGGSVRKARAQLQATVHGGFKRLTQ